MKVYLGLNEILPDGMGSAALNLLTALRLEGVDCQPVHPTKEIQIPDYMRFSPVFVYDTAEKLPLNVIIPGMIDVINHDPQCTHFTHFGGPVWGAVIPYLRPDIKVVVSIHNTTPSTLKSALAYKKRTSVFVPVSWGVEELLKKKLPVSERHKIRRVLNAIDINQYFKKDFSKKNQPPKILYMGRIEDVGKGCDKIPKIARILKERGLNFMWDLYGYFHWGYEKNFFADLKRYDVEDVIKHKGCLVSAQLHEVIPQYDVMVMPSNHEGFGLVLVEAMASGVPCVASHLKGVTNCILENGKSGVLVKRNDIEGFADAIELLLKNENLRVTMGGAGYNRARECFDLKVHGENYRQVLEYALTDQVAYQQQIFEPESFKLPESLKPHIAARILPLWLKKRLKRVL